MYMDQIRRWLGLYFILITTGLGGYIIVFRETMLLPISEEDARCAFNVIIPTFVAQLIVIFRWVGSSSTRQGGATSLPAWAVLGPPIAVAGVLLVTIMTLVVDGGRSLNGGSIFRGIVTFSVSILGASTVFLVTRVFPFD